MIDEYLLRLLKCEPIDPSIGVSIRYRTFSAFDGPLETVTEQDFC